MKTKLVYHNNMKYLKLDKYTSRKRFDIKITLAMYLKLLGYFAKAILLRLIYSEAVMVSW